MLGRYWLTVGVEVGQAAQIAQANRTMCFIPRCGTGKLGAMPFRCDSCGSEQLWLRSCGNRHCPVCSGPRRRQWRDRLVRWSLDCDYLHVVFTVPHELNDVIRDNQRLLYKQHFNCVGDVLQRTAERHYGCRIGIVQVLHTWGQQLGLHVHIHVVMTAGGLSLDGDRWLPISADDEVMRREVLAEKFRATYLRRLKTRVKKGKIDWPDSARVIEKVAGKGWVVNVQAPPPKCVGATAVINYLSSYVIGGPISDRRMIADIDGMVAFGFKNYTTDRMEQATIPGAEFTRRFSRHILPKRFGRVRYMGLFQAAGRAERLRHCQRLIEEAGLSRSGDGSTSAVRLLGHEHDEDEIEHPCDDDGERQPGLNVTMCDSCQEKRTTDPEDWLDSRQAMRLLAIVATIYVGLSRAGESMLMQIQWALVEHRAIRAERWKVRELRQIETMLVECLEDPRRLLRGVLGRDHPLIRAATAAAEQAARPPPESKAEAGSG